MARHIGTARAAALSLLPLVALIHSTSGRTIRMLGPQYLGAEAGIQWNDVCTRPPFPHQAKYCSLQARPNHLCYRTAP